jgi:hypothetical protein
MYRLFDEDTKALIGAITQAQLDYLIAQLEEEGIEDRDYAITPMTLALFEGENVEPVLISMLRTALGERDEMSIYWEETQ